MNAVSAVQVEEDSLETLIGALGAREGEQWALRNIKTTICIDEIIKDIANGMAVGVSDGSFKDEGGTAAWIIENEAGTQRIMGTVEVPGYGSDQSAYRSELVGIYAMIVIVEKIKEMWTLTGGCILIGCDGKVALDQALNIKDNMTSYQQQQFDMISGIQGYIQVSTIEYLPFHIKGHQDSKKKMEDLSRLELLNVEVDWMVKDYRAEKYDNDIVKQRRYYKYVMPMRMWKISFMGTRVINKVVPFLRESIEGGKAAEYWVTNKHRFTKESFFLVDWETNKKAMGSVNLSRRHWVTKFKSGFCGTGRMMKIWRQRVIDNYTRYGAANEDTPNILQCTSASAQTVGNKAMQKLED